MTQIVHCSPQSSFAQSALQHRTSCDSNEARPNMRCLCFYFVPITSLPVRFPFHFLSAHYSPSSLCFLFPFLLHVFPKLPFLFSFHSFNKLLSKFHFSFLLSLLLFLFLTSLLFPFLFLSFALVVSPFLYSVLVFLNPNSPFSSFTLLSFPLVFTLFPLHHQQKAFFNLS